MLKLLCEHRWRVFSDPLTPDERKQVEEAGGEPMDLLTILGMIDTRQIEDLAQFVSAINAIVATVRILYDMSVNEEARVISRACALQVSERREAFL